MVHAAVLIKHLARTLHLTAIVVGKPLVLLTASAAALQTSCSGSKSTETGDSIESRSLLSTLTWSTESDRECAGYVDTTRVGPPSLPMRTPKLAALMVLSTPAKGHT